MGFKDVGLDFDFIPSDGFKPGTTLCGRAKFVLDRPMKVKNIMLSFEGSLRVGFFTDIVNWCDDRPGSKQSDVDVPKSFGNIFDVNWNNVGCLKCLSESSFFKFEEVFLKIEQLLAEEIRLEGGTVFIPFQFYMPDNMPSSFKGTHGAIRYKIRLKWILDGFFSLRDTYKVEIPVLNSNQLKNPELQKPKIYYKVEHFGIFTPTDPVKITIKLPKSAVMKDELINVDILINNTSTVEVNTIFVRFIQRTAWLGAYHKYYSVMTEDEVIQEFRYDGLPALTFKSWTQPIKIISEPLVCIDSCTSIKRFHLIMVEVVPSGVHKIRKINVVAPIRIFSDWSKEPSGLTGYSSQSKPSSSHYYEKDPPPPYPGLPRVSLSTMKKS